MNIEFISNPDTGILEAWEDDRVIGEFILTGMMVKCWKLTDCIVRKEQKRKPSNSKDNEERGGIVMTAKRNIDDYKDRMTSPIGITVTTKRSEEEIELTFIEPDDYFTEDMLKVLEEGERAHNNDEKK